MPHAPFGPELISETCIIALLATAVWLVLSAGRVNLGITTFSTGAAFVTASLVNAGLPIALAAAAGVLTTVLAGLLVGLLLARASAVQFAIATLIFGGAANYAFGVVIPLNSHSLVTSALVTTGLAPTAVIVSVGAALFGRSRFGFACAAVAQDERTAQSVGINPVLTRLLAFAAGAAVAGMCGALDIIHAGYLNEYDYGLERNVVAIAAAVIGGVGSGLGPLTGAIVLSATALLPQRLQMYRQALESGLLLACAIALPGGLASIAARITRK